MRRHLVKRLLVVLLAFTVVLPSLAVTSVYAFDEEMDGEFDFYEDPYFDPYEEPQPEPQPEPEPEPQPEPQPEPTPEPEPQPEPQPEPTPEPEPQPLPGQLVAIKSAPSEASFGTVDIGEPATITVKVTSVGTTACNLTWYEVENDDFFAVTAPPVTTLMPGDTVNFILSLKAVPEGSYAGSISFIGTDATGMLTSSDSTRVTATVKGKTPVVDSVVVSPNSVELGKGGSAQFSATVKGSNLPTTNVSWTVNDKTSSNTSINSNGYLVVGADEESSLLTVVATSDADPTVQGNARVNVQSAKQTHYVSVIAGEGGTVSGGGTVADGEGCTIYASPSGNYSFVGWYDSSNVLVSNKKTYTITSVKTDLTLVAKFNRNAARVIINRSPEEGGFTKGDGTYNVGSNVTVKAEPANGYKFVGWKYNDKVISKEKEYTLTNLNGEYRITALFEKNRYNVCIDVSPANAGAVDGAGAYDPGSDAKLQAYAATGYNFKGWYQNYKLVSSDPKLTLKNIKNDCSLTALFEKPGTTAYIMTSTAGTGGIITPAVSAPVPAGTTVTYIITPSTGYYISGLKVDGKLMAAAATYTFSNVTSNHSIEAIFAKKDEAKASKTSENSKVVTGKTVEEAQKEVAAVLKDETKKSQAQEQLAETIVNTDMDTLTGVLQKYNMTPEEAYLHINDEVGVELFTAAYEDGLINVVVNNDFDTEGKVSRLNYENYDSLTPAVSNLEEVYDTVVTDTEAIGTLEGKAMEIHWDITNTTGITSEEEMNALSQVAKQSNLAIDNTFDITILKTYDGMTSLIPETGVPSVITLKVPDTLKLKGGQYKILHIHNGEVEVLENTSEDPNFITFSTSKFSTFAMAYEATEAAEVGQITGNEAMVYVDTINNTPSAAASASKKISPIVIALIITIVVSVVLLVVVILLTVGRKGGHSGKPHSSPRQRA